jgi:uncharacterized protein YjbJ (UPF0337 family)
MGEYTDKAKGEIKEKSGKLTGDKKLEWEGKGDKAKGHVQGAGRNLDEGLNEPSTDEGRESDGRV